MYCPSCGNEIKNALNFCNRCGGKIEKRDTVNSLSNFQTIATAIGIVGLGGMIVVLVLALKLLKEGVEIGAIGVIIGMFLITILAIVYMVIRLMPQYLEKPSSNEIAQTEYIAPRSLSAATTSQLKEPHQTPASVIEDTTLALDEVFVKKN